MTDVETVAHALYVAKGAQNIFGPWDSNLYPGIKGPFMRQAQGLLGPIIARERAAAIAAATPLIEARVREECAHVADGFDAPHLNGVGERVAAAIREGRP